MDFARRVFCVPDPAARVAAVIVRMPAKWWRVGRWDLVTGTYDEGAWYHGVLYPQRCDLSPGGRYLSYFTLNPGTDWPAGECYNAVSRLPWLRALAAWSEYGTWSRGFHFVDDPIVWEVGDPAVGGAAVREAVGGMRVTEPAQFAVERRRGWQELASTPPRDSADGWDQERDNVVMEKPSPGGGRVVLSVAGRFEAFRNLADLWPPAPKPYSLTRKGVARPLAGVRWADWTADGVLAAVTDAGALQVRDGERVVHEALLGTRGPKPGPAPVWAGEW